MTNSLTREQTILALCTVGLVLALIAKSEIAITFAILPAVPIVLKKIWQEGGFQGRIVCGAVAAAAFLQLWSMI